MSIRQSLSHSLFILQSTILLHHNNNSNKITNDNNNNKNNTITKIPIPDLFASSILTEMGHGAVGTTPPEPAFNPDIYTAKGVITNGLGVSNADCKTQYSTAITPRNIADYMLCVTLGTNRQVCEVRCVSVFMMVV